MNPGNGFHADLTLADNLSNLDSSFYQRFFLRSNLPSHTIGHSPACISRTALSSHAYIYVLPTNPSLFHALCGPGQLCERQVDSGEGFNERSVKRILLV